VKVPERIYEKLSAHERFLAAVEAFGREDGAEVDRLNDACPYETVRLQSLAYFGRLRGFYDVAMMHGIEARNLAIAIWAMLAKLYMSCEPQTDDVAEGRKELEQGIPGTEVQGPPTSDTEEAEEDSEGEVLFALIARLRAHAVAWAAFCGRLGVDPEKAAFAYYRQSLDIASIFADVEADEQCLAELADVLQKAWDHRVSRSEPRRESR
jgi:hypothetical protein